MRESTALIKVFDGGDDIISENATTLAETFKMPSRNWNLLVDDFNTRSKRKFPYTALECHNILELVKRGIPAKSVFVAVGSSPYSVGQYFARYNELDDRLSELISKESLTDDEFDEFNNILRNPMRVLIADIKRAEGIREIRDWELFVQKAETATDLQMMLMKAKYKDYFSDKPADAGTNNVVINLGGDWLDRL